MQFPRESVFLSTVRGFFTSFGILMGLFIAAVAIGCFMMFFSGSNMYPAPSKLMVAPDAKGDRHLLSHSAPVILKIDIKGVIGMKELTADKIQTCLFDSREGMLGENRVKGILLHMNTPGGTVSDSDAIYRALLDYKKKYQVPVYVYVDGLCASGGMYIASAADKILSSNTSVIGSVGVTMGTSFNVSKLLDVYGIESLTLKAGKDKDMLNPFRTWQPGEDESLRQILSVLYTQFVDIVSMARPQLDKRKLVDEYGAQVYVAQDALKLGYIDAIDMDYNTALTALVQAANLGENADYQVFEISPAHSFLASLTEGKSSLLKGKISHELTLEPLMSPELSGKFLYFYRP